MNIQQMRDSMKISSQVLSLLVLLVGGSLPVRADGELATLLTAADKLRLERFTETRQAAIKDATDKGDARDVEELNRILDGAALSLSGSFDATGDWKCRTIKLGGDPALVIYGWFKCRISDDGAGWYVEKLTGSQRTSGRLFTDSDTRLVYIGAGHYADEQPRKYQSDSDRDQVAYVTRPTENRLRFEFPEPKYESRFDVLEFER